MARINWRIKNIESLQEIYHIDETKATEMYNQLYRKALKIAGGKQTNLKVSRELYASINYRGAQLFNISKDLSSVKINPELNPNISSYGALGMARMDAFFAKYGDKKMVQAARDDYLNGKISREEFNYQIKMFKKYDSSYLKAGS